MILGMGTDIVAVHRLGNMVGARGHEFLDRWFTAEEAAYCLAKAHPARHLAARLAAKEAVAKALRLDLDRRVPWRQIEVVLDQGGVPGIRLHGDLVDQAPKTATWHVSLSHSDDHAVATAVLELVEPATPAPPAHASVDTPAVVADLLDDLRRWVGQDVDPELGALRAALLIEEVTGAVLTDAEIDPARLADRETIAHAMRRTEAMS